MPHRRLAADHIPVPNGDDVPGSLHGLLLASTASRDQAIDRIGRSVENLASDFSRKLEESERDTRKQFDTFNASVANQFQNITTRFDAAMAGRDAKFEAFSTKVLEGRQAPWALMISAAVFVMLLCGAIGGLAYAPITTRTANIERAMEKLVDNQALMREFVTTNFVSQKDLDARTDRGREDRERTNRAIEAIQANIFTRDVHKQHWDNIDAAIAATNLRIESSRADLQRQLDTIQKSLGDTYTARDVIMESRNRITELERLIRDMLAHRPAGTGP